MVSRATVSKYLKWGQNRGLIIRDIDTRKYKLTKKGKEYLKLLDQLEEFEAI